MTSTLPPGRRARLPRDQRRVLLLDAALDAFSENGYHATAMDDIAERAGVSKPVLYQHFDSKLDLYLAIAQRVAAEVVRTIEEALASTEDNGERITACLSSFFAFVDRPASGFPLLFRSDMGAEPAVATVLDQTRLACGEAMGRVLAEETELPFDECVLLGITMAGLAQSAALHWYDTQEHLPRERVIELVTTVAWRGLGAVPPREGHAEGSG